MLRYLLSKGEITLLKEIEDISYGELQNIKAIDQAEARDITATSKQVNFIKALRSEGYLDTVTIFDGEPTLAEIAGVTESGHPYVKKIKF